MLKILSIWFIAFLSLSSLSCYAEENKATISIKNFCPEHTIHVRKAAYSNSIWCSILSYGWTGKGSTQGVEYRVSVQTSGNGRPCAYIVEPEGSLFGWFGGKNKEVGGESFRIGTASVNYTMSDKTCNCD